MFASDISEKRKHRLILLLLFLICVFTRGGWILYLQHVDPGLALSNDSPSYIGPAKSFLEHQRLNTAPDSKQPMFLRTPGYPLFLAMIFALFGEHAVPALMVQVLLSAIIVFLVYAIAVRLWTPAAALLSAILVTVEPLLFCFPGIINTECLHAFLLTLMAYTIVVAFKRKHLSFRWFSLLGLITALSVHVRPIMYYFPILFLLILCAGHIKKREAGNRILVTAVAFLYPIVILVGSWQIRNYYVVGSWRFSGIEAFNLYVYRAAGVLAELKGAPHTDLKIVMRNEINQIPEMNQGPHYDRFYKAGLKIVLSHPRELLVITGKGFVSEVFGVRYPLFQYLRISKEPLLIALAQGLLLSFYVMVLLGVFNSIRSADPLPHLFILSIPAYILLLSAGPEANPRFRMPIMPLLCLYAGQGTAMAYLRMRKSALFSRTEAKISTARSRV